MRFALPFLAAIGCLAAAGTGIAAERITYSGSGVVSTVGGRLVPTGTVPLGSALNFSFAFDPAAASLIQSEDGYALYELAVSDFSATLGVFAFPLSHDVGFTPLVELSRGFSFFGDTPFSEPSIAFTFYLLGEPTTAAADTPFAGNPGRNQQLALGGVLRADETAPLTVAGLLDLGDAFYQNFQYGTRDVTLRQSGLLSGDLSASFSAAAVPEPATWTLMIVGFGVVGAALRRRQFALRVERPRA